jgi:serine protease Do
VQAAEGEGGVKVVRTTPDGPARSAGLKDDDVITAIDGKTFDGPIQFGGLIRGYQANDEIELTYRRGDKEEKLKVKLVEREEGDSSRRFQRMNEMSGPLSARLSGFPEALQHDIPLSPSECGGPLLDLSGRCVAINVSRAGRVQTLAVPASDVQKLLAEARTESTPEATPAETADAAAMKVERQKVLMELGEVEKRLKELEERLSELNAR